MPIATLRSDTPARGRAENFPITRYPLPPNLIAIPIESGSDGARKPNEAAAVAAHEDDHLLNARQVAERLGVSERWVRDHTTRRSPHIRGVKLGTLMRYRRADIDLFMQELDTLPSSRRFQNGV